MVGCLYELAGAACRPSTQRPGAVDVRLALSKAAAAPTTSVGGSTRTTWTIAPSRRPRAPGSIPQRVARRSPRRLPPAERCCIGQLPYQAPVCGRATTSVARGLIKLCCCRIDASAATLISAKSSYLSDAMSRTVLALVQASAQADAIRLYPFRWEPLMSSKANDPLLQINSPRQGGEEEFRIRDQMKRVASLTPGTERHRIATEVLLLLQDGAHVMTEARAMLREARLLTSHTREIDESGRL